MLERISWLFILLTLVAINTSSKALAQNYEAAISTVSIGEKDDAVEKAQFKVGEKVQVKVSVTNLAETKMNAPKGEDYYRPRLYRNGQLVAYRKEIAYRIEKQNNGGSFRVTGFWFLEPHKPQTDNIDLSYWYSPLKSGQYQLSLERLFFKRERATSNVVFFEVVQNQQ